MKVSRLFILTIVLMAMVLGFSMQAHANLNLLGQGTSTYGAWNLIYDTDLDITWYDYTATDITFVTQNAQAAGLSVTTAANTYDDWRLPLCSEGVGPSGTCTNSEMQHLYSTEGVTFSDPGDFQNLVQYGYWSGTEKGVGAAYRFKFSDGAQQASTTGSKFYGIAVMDGMAIVPEPISAILFIVGGATLGFRRFRKRVNG